MNLLTLLTVATALLPAVLMGLALVAGRGTDVGAAWRRFGRLAVAAAAAALAHLALQGLQAGEAPQALAPGLAASQTGAWVAVLVQGLGTVIGFFSARYLQGEPGQVRYAGALGGVLVAVHLLLLADHWLVLIAAWAAAGLALERLLCFYGDRPFARLAAHKKRVADRGADLLLVVAATLAWQEVGSGSLTALWRHVEAGAPSLALQASAWCLVGAVLLRTAVLPVHGWLIQVMEAPTPVSALLHAGVVNLGGFVLIRFAPLVEAAPGARWLLVVAGAGTAVLAGLVMLTRISIKVRLAWSTVAQMGFMVMECGLGLYTLALLHLLGHSLYKAHAFLAASSVVDETRRRQMRGPVVARPASLLLAPLASGALVMGLVAAWGAVTGSGTWPLWWSAVLALAWAPLLWQPAERPSGAPGALSGLLSGGAMVVALAVAALVGHALPLGVQDAPLDAAGGLALVAMAVLYLGLTLMQTGTPALAGWRRWSYAGFYVDEYVTRAALRLWPARWTAATPE